MTRTHTAKHSPPSRATATSRYVTVARGLASTTVTSTGGGGGGAQRQPPLPPSVAAPSSSSSSSSSGRGPSPPPRRRTIWAMSSWASPAAPKLSERAERSSAASSRSSRWRRAALLCSRASRSSSSCRMRPSRCCTVPWYELTEDSSRLTWLFDTCSCSASSMFWRRRALFSRSWASRSGWSGGGGACGGGRRDRGPVPLPSSSCSSSYSAW